MSDDTKTLVGLLICNFGKWWRHMKTKNRNPSGCNASLFDPGAYRRFFISQIGSMSPCVCSVIDHSWRQHVVRTKKSGTRGDSWVCHRCCWLPHYRTLSFFCYFSLKERLQSAARFHQQRHSYFILGLEVKEEKEFNCDLPGLLYSRHIPVVLRHWNKNEEFNQLLWWSSEIFLLHISVSICRELFSFLKNRNS